MGAVHKAKIWTQAGAPTNVKEKNKTSFNEKSPKKTNNKNKSSSKNVLNSPVKSPKKRRKKFPPKPEKKEHDGTIIADPHFDPDRTAHR